MSEKIENPLWVWQGFFGAMDAATAAKAAADKDSRAGVVVPVVGAPPMAVDTDETMGMFAVQTRPADPIPCPLGMREANPAMVGRMVGA